MFLTMRQRRVDEGNVDLHLYSPVLTYERLGQSSLLSAIYLPEGGDTVLFPGCALPSSRPETVKRLFEALQHEIPKIGVALGCCSKPSHDLGRRKFFEERFGVLHERLLEVGIKRVVTTCPNCQKIFAEYGSHIEAVTAYELLVASDFESCQSHLGGGILHDPCPQRFDEKVQDAVRGLAARSGLELVPVRHERSKTRCCGEGGMVKFVRPDLAERWTTIHAEVEGAWPVLTSCAGCAQTLGEAIETVHILDVVFGSIRHKPIRPPLTYIGRFFLKRWFKRKLHGV
jgi:Fe-S oxidoreductase